MQLFVIIGIIIICCAIKKEKFPEKESINLDDTENNKNFKSKLKKFLYGVILFILLFIIYCLRCFLFCCCHNKISPFLFYKRFI